MKYPLLKSTYCMIAISILSFSCGSADTNSHISKKNNKDKTPVVVDFAPTYYELARRSIPRAYDVVKVDFDSFDETLLPHLGKEPRKNIVLLRDMVDIFVYAYAKSDPDFILAFRKALDEGYFLLGDFKDLYDTKGDKPDVVRDEKGNITDWGEIDYNEKNVKKARKKVLNWVEDFNARFPESFVRGIFSNPEFDIIERKKSHLSRFYWGGIDKLPKVDKTGAENISRLTKGQLKLAIDEYNDFIEVDNLTIPENEIKFHDFRKRIRVVEKLVTYFNEVITDFDNPDFQNVFNLLIETVDELGNIEDDLVRFANKKEDSNYEFSKLVELRNKIKEDWAILSAQLRSESFADTLDEFKDHLID